MIAQNNLQPIGVVSPGQVQKIVKAWKNVVAEEEMAKAAAATAKVNSSVGNQKGVKLVV